MPRGIPNKKKRAARSDHKEENNLREIPASTPTLRNSDGFSDFMGRMQMTHYKRRSEVLVDARSQVLLGLAEVLQVNAAAVMHLADITNTAPNYNQTESIKTTPVE